MERERPTCVNIPCVILAYGNSNRFGSPKGLAMLNGQSLLSRIVKRLRAQSRGPIVLNADPEGPYANQGLKLIPDKAFVGEGPLAGVLTALQFASAKGFDRVLTTPVDTPLIPVSLIERLEHCSAAAVAKSAYRMHPVCGLWSTRLVESLSTFLQSGERSAIRWVNQIGAEITDFAMDEAIDPFTNVNTVDELNALSIELARANQKNSD